MFTRGWGFDVSARIWTRMLAMVRRFQKATAVAPKRVEPAIRNAVDHRPRLGVGSIGRTAVICSRSCVLCFRDNFIFSSVLSRALATGLPGQYGTSVGIFSYLSLESIEKRIIYAGTTGLPSPGATAISMKFGRISGKNI